MNKLWHMLFDKIKPLERKYGGFCTITQFANDFADLYEKENLYVAFLEVETRVPEGMQEAFKERVEEILLERKLKRERKVPNGTN